MNNLDVYHRLPIWLQNAALNLYGYNICRTRYNKAFQRVAGEIKERNSYTAEEMQNYQNRRLSAIIEYAYQNVPYYRRKMDRHHIKPEMIKNKDDLKMLPIISKEVVKDDFEQFYVKGVKKTKDYFTGGTTGSPLVLKTTDEEIRYNFAFYEVRAKDIFNVYTGQKTAVFLGKHIVAPWVKKPPFWRKCASLSQTMYSIYHMDNNTLKYYVEDLRKNIPVYITGYVNPVYQLAQYIEKNNLQPIPIRAIFLSSETLNEWQKEVIEKAFSCKVCNGYSQAEGVSFISTCPCGKLHVQPDYGVTEFIRVDGTNYFEIVGTTLFNYTMPLIRYRTRDYVLLDEKQKCECGLPFFPIVKEIIGRDDSSLKSPSGKVFSSAALSLIFKSFPQIYETQLLQKKIDEIEIMLVINGEITEEFKKEFTRKICSVIGNEFNISLFKVNAIPKSSLGKHRLIVSQL